MDNNNNEKEKNNHLAIDSELKGIKIGDHVFTADFVNDSNGGCKFDIKEFEVKSEKKIMGKSNYYEIFDVRFPKGIIKSDLESGFFKTSLEAEKAFVDAMEFIFLESKKAYEKDAKKE